MFKIRKKSGWKYDTSAGGSVGVGVVTAGAGSLWFMDSNEMPAKYNYVSGGGGFSVGAKVSVASSTIDSCSAGTIYILESFRGDELSRKDFEGFCISSDASIGAVLGASGTVMVLGVSWSELPAAALNMGLAPEASDAARDTLQKSGWMTAGNGPPQASSKLIDTFKGAGKALLIMGGFNSGPQLTIGVSASLGRVWEGATPQWKGTDEALRQMDLTPSYPVETTFKTSSKSQDSSYISIPAQLLFDFDKYQIKPTAFTELGKIADMVKSRRPRSLCVEGHADSMGGHSYNFQLSTNRAQAVARWLVSHNAIESGKVSVIGHGDLVPIAPNNTPQNRQKNRRVEIFLNQG